MGILTKLAKKSIPQEKLPKLFVPMIDLPIFIRRPFMSSQKKKKVDAFIKKYDKFKKKSIEKYMNDNPAIVIGGLVLSPVIGSWIGWKAMQNEKKRKEAKK